MSATGLGRCWRFNRRTRNVALRLYESTPNFHESICKLFVCERARALPRPNASSGTYCSGQSEMPLDLCLKSAYVPLRYEETAVADDLWERSTRIADHGGTRRHGLQCRPTELLLPGGCRPTRDESDIGAPEAPRGFTSRYQSVKTDPWPRPSPIQDRWFARSSAGDRNAEIQPLDQRVANAHEIRDTLLRHEPTEERKFRNSHGPVSEPPVCLGRMVAYLRIDLPISNPRPRHGQYATPRREPPCYICAKTRPADCITTPFQHERRNAPPYSSPESCHLRTVLGKLNTDRDASAPRVGHRLQCHHLPRFGFDMDHVWPRSPRGTAEAFQESRRPTPPKPAWKNPQCIGTGVRAVRDRVPLSPHRRHFSGNHAERADPFGDTIEFGPIFTRRVCGQGDD